MIDVKFTSFAAAALKEDGSVVTWGKDTYGGDSSLVAAKLRSGVVEITSNPYAFLARKIDGSVVTWGKPESGGSIVLPPLD